MCSSDLSKLPAGTQTMPSRSVPGLGDGQRANANAMARHTMTAPNTHGAKRASKRSIRFSQWPFPFLCYRSGPLHRDLGEQVMGLGLNQRSFTVLDGMARQATDLRVNAQTVEGARVIDAGVHAVGGLNAGILLARACMAEISG